MEQYDYNKLLGRMREKRFTQDALAEKIGISATSMNLSLNNNRDIPLSKIPDYFFCRAALEN